METNIKDIFADRLKMLREEKGLSQNELAKEVDISRGSVSYYENSDRTAGIDFIYKAARYFNCSADFLLGLTEHRNEAERESLTEDFEELENLYIHSKMLNKYKILHSLITIFNEYNDFYVDNDYCYEYDQWLSSILENIELLTAMIMFTQHMYCIKDNSITKEIAEYQVFVHDIIGTKLQGELYSIISNYFNSISDLPKKMFEKYSEDQYPNDFTDIADKLINLAFKNDELINSAFKRNKEGDTNGNHRTP